MDLLTFLKTSYTPRHAVKNIERMLQARGAVRLDETDIFDTSPADGSVACGRVFGHLDEGALYYVKRGGSIILFRTGENGQEKFAVVASHTDSPCLKLKENAALSDGQFTRLNTEPYGGGLWYTFFDRPLKLAGRVIRPHPENPFALVSELFESDFDVVLPSLAIHQNREANEKFAPNLQTELPLLSLGKTDFDRLLNGAIAYDLFAVPDVAPFVSGAQEEFLSSPRLDDLAGVYTSVCALLDAAPLSGTTQVCACLEAEEIGSRTYAGAGADFLRSTLERIAGVFASPDSFTRSLLLSLDNAHSLHPNHPETCDPTNRVVLGGGVVIKGHAGGAYTTDAMTSAMVKTMLRRAGVPFQTFYNRSDARSGSTLGAISLSEVSLPSVDIGLAQLAMHSAVETMARSDLDALKAALDAFYAFDLHYHDDSAIVYRAEDDR